MKYKCSVVFSYWQEIELEALDIQEAQDKAFNLFDINKAYKGDGEIHKTEILKPELSDSDLAFMKAYQHAVAVAPKEAVRKFLECKDHDKFWDSDSEYYASITDAYEIWLMAQSFIKENSK
jgi:hypothetical protein